MKLMIAAFILVGLAAAFLFIEQSRNDVLIDHYWAMQQ